MLKGISGLQKTGCDASQVWLAVHRAGAAHQTAAAGLRDRHGHVGFIGPAQHWQNQVHKCVRRQWRDVVRVQRHLVQSRDGFERWLDWKTDQRRATARMRENNPGQRPADQQVEQKQVCQLYLGDEQQVSVCMHAACLECWHKGYIRQPEVIQ